MLLKLLEIIVYIVLFGLYLSLKDLFFKMRFGVFLYMLFFEN